MNKDAILKTAITRWDEADQCYITESPLLDTLSGDGDTVEASMESFRESVELNDAFYRKGQHALYPKSGRPRKGKVGVHAEVKPSVKDGLTALSKNIGVSQGETIEYLYAFYQAKQG